jgi:peptidylprolyl isomerase
VNNRAPGRTTPASGRATTNKRRMAKRLAAQRAAAERAARRRRKRLAIGGVAAVAVIAVIVLIVVSSGGSKSGHKAASPAPSASVSASAFPPLPPGADPALGTKPTVSAGSGTLTKLTVTPLVQGKGEPTTAGQTISVNYVGVSYTTGKEFDSSWSRSEPFSFPLGQGQVIKGWDQGLVGVKVGSRVQLDIPADLAYGDNPTGGQPAGALRFVVDVLSAH